MAYVFSVSRDGARIASLLTVCKDDCNTFYLYRDICSIPHQPRQWNVYFGQTSRGVCEELCSISYSWDCSGFLFSRTNNSCILTSYTGETGADQPCNPSEQLEFYRRNRCLGKSTDTVVTSFCSGDFGTFCWLISTVGFIYSSPCSEACAILHCSCVFSFNWWRIYN